MLAIASLVVLKFLKGALPLPRVGALTTPAVFPLVPTRPPKLNRGGRSSWTAFGKIIGRPERPSAALVKLAGSDWSGRMSIELWL